MTIYKLSKFNSKDVLWLQLEKNGKTSILPILYEYENGRVIDILNGIVYKTKNKSKLDTIPNEYLIPEDVYNEISKKAKIKNVYTYFEIQLIVKDGGVLLNKISKNDKNKPQIKGSVVNNKKVGFKELKQTTKEYLSKIKDADRNKVEQASDEDLHL